MAKASRNRKYTKKTRAAEAMPSLPLPLLALALEACGGGGGGASVSNAGNQQMEDRSAGLELIPQSGRVLDGPIQGARVYVDADSNGVLSPAPPGGGVGDILIGITNGSGYYSGRIQKRYENNLLLVDLSGATDIGDPADPNDNTPLTGGVWRAPADSKIISPLTHVLTHLGGLSWGGRASGLSPFDAEIDVTEFDPYRYGQNEYTLEELQTIIAGMAVAEVIRQVQQLNIPFTTAYINEDSIYIPVGITALAKEDLEQKSLSVRLDEYIDTPPSEISLSSASVTIAEGTYADGRKLADITFTDTDYLSNNKASVVNNSIFEIENDTQLWLKATADLDYETVQQHRITIGAKNNLRLKEVFILKISNEADPEEGVIDGQLNPIEVSVYENHPIHKAVYDLKDLHAEIDGFELTANYGDNDLFEIDNGRIWFLAPPDYTANGDNILEIEVERTEIDGSMTTSLFEVTVKDILLERTYTTGLSSMGGAEKQYFFPRYLAADNQPSLQIQEMLLGGIWSRDDRLMPSDPLTLTWSLKVDSRSPGYFDLFEKNAPDFPHLGLDNQSGIDNARLDLTHSFDEIESHANLKFIEVAENDNSVGDISIQFYQGYSGNQGSVLMNYSNDKPSSMKFISSDNYDLNKRGYYLVLHELLHSVGFGHPFETHADPDRGQFWPGDFNRYNDETTLSSYHQTSGYATNGDLTPLDMDVLQYLYGTKDGTTVLGVESRFLNDSELRPANASPTAMSLHTHDNDVSAGIQAERLLAEVTFTDSDGDPYGSPTNRVTISTTSDNYMVQDVFELRNNDEKTAPDEASTNPQLWLKPDANLSAGEYQVALTATTNLVVIPPADVLGDPSATLQEIFTLVVEA